MLVDQKTIELAQKGDDAAQSKLYEQFFEQIFRFIFTRVSHKQTAEDLSEEVFITVFKRLSSLTSPDAFTGWLYTIARNKVIDHYRSRKEVSDLSEVENSTDFSYSLVDAAELSFTQKRLMKAIEQLSPEQQKVVQLKFLEDLETSTIASLLGKTTGAIRVIQHRALIELKIILSKDDQN
jgi:RNA polymerase sigma-70 factor (ECF subfamily)